MPGQGYWLTRPPAGTPVDPAHPLAQGLRYLWTCSEGAGGVQNALGGKGLGFTTAPLLNAYWSMTKRGSCMTFFPNSGFMQFEPDAVLGLPTVEATLLWGYQKLDGTARSSGAFGVTDGASAIGTHLPYADGTVYWDFGGNSEGSTRLSVSSLTFGDDLWAFTTGSRGMEIWQNGVRRASNSATPTRTNSGGAFYWGKHDGVTDCDFAAIWHCAIYGRQLTAGEIQAVSAAPYSMFAPPVWRRYFVPAGAAVTTVERRTLSPLGARVGSRQAS